MKQGIAEVVMVEGGGCEICVRKASFSPHVPFWEELLGQVDHQMTPLSLWSWQAEVGRNWELSSVMEVESVPF